MARYRKIDPRIWNDEKFMTFDPREKLVWFTLLTHPLMTPMGAGVIYEGVLDDIIGNSREWCFRCQCPCTQHTAETYLETFRKRSLIYRNKGLLIVKNYLLYNLPDTPQPAPVLDRRLRGITTLGTIPRSPRPPRKRLGGATGLAVYGASDSPCQPATSRAGRAVLGPRRPRQKGWRSRFGKP